jgi:hypothetical protein
MPALRELIRRYGVDVGTHLDRDADIPVLTAPQVQGDVSVRPVRRRRQAVTPLPPQGVVIATGREGHEHRLLPGPARFDPAAGPARSLLRIGTLTVPADCEQYVAHDQHGYLGIGPGTYELGRQREWTPPPARIRRARWRNILD